MNVRDFDGTPAGEEKKGVVDSLVPVHRMT